MFKANVHCEFNFEKLFGFLVFVFNIDRINLPINCWDVLMVLNLNDSIQWMCHADFMWIAIQK